MTTVSRVSPTLIAAAHLADPVGMDEGIVADISSYVNELPGLLQRNRVSLLPAQRSGMESLRNLLAQEPLAAYLAEEKRAYQHVRQEYAAIRAAFVHAGIRDVLIKSAGMTPSFPHLSDNVDDLVATADVPAARSVLFSLGYVELRNLEEPHKFFFKRFSAGQEVAAHHLHEHVGWAVSFLDEPFLLHRAYPAPDDPDLLIPHPEDAFLITTAHAFYENKALKLGDVVKVRHCLRSGQLDWEHMRFLAERKGWLDGLHILIYAFSRLDVALYGTTLFPPEIAQQAEQALAPAHRAYLDSLFARPLVMPLPISFVFSKRLFYAKCLHDHQRSASGKVYDIVRHTLNGAKLKLKVHSQPGMLITFSGVDGCGKTRHAEALITAFRRCDIRASYVWTRTGSSSLTDAVVRVGKALLRRPAAQRATSQEERAQGRRVMLRNPLVRLGWTALVVLDLLWQYTLRVRLPLLAGRVVVCDRYVYDAIADIMSVTDKANAFLLRLLVLLNPKPSLLEADPSPTQGSSLPAFGASDRGRTRPACSRVSTGVDTPPSAQADDQPQAPQVRLRTADETRVMMSSHREGRTRAAFLLTIAPGAAVARHLGDPLPEGTVRSLSNIYMAMAGEYDLTIVDNTPAFAQVNDPLVRQVLRTYFARYRTIVNALLLSNPSSNSRGGTIAHT